jgi:hypothetical protein
MNSPHIPFTVTLEEGYQLIDEAYRDDADRERARDNFTIQYLRRHVAGETSRRPIKNLIRF